MTIADYMRRAHWAAMEKATVPPEGWVGLAWKEVERNHERALDTLKRAILASATWGPYYDQETGRVAFVQPDGFDRGGIQLVFVSAVDATGVSPAEQPK